MFTPVFPVDVYPRRRDSAGKRQYIMTLQEFIMLPLRARHHWSKLFTLALVLCVLLLTSFASQANPRMNERQQREQPERRQEQARARISAAQAAALVEQRYGGKVMGVQTRQGSGGVVYSVKILQSSGHMRTVNVDGQSGAILN